ncbi:MAG: SLC13 family permease [Lautropia sp.]|nr:SLC13 family permease [Lautropia sp.]
MDPIHTTLLLLLFATVMFAWEKIPLAVTSVIVCLTLAITGVLDPKTAFHGFVDPNVILFVSMFVVGAALFETGMANKIGGLVTRFAKNETQLTVALMTIAAILSGALSNTGTAAVLIPVVIGIASRPGISRSRLLMPMAFATAIGGNLTLIGSPSNLIAQSALQSIDKGFSFFEYAKIGIPMLFVGILFFIGHGRRLLPTRDEASDHGDSPGLRAPPSGTPVPQHPSQRVESGPSVATAARPPDGTQPATIAEPHASDAMIPAGYVPAQQAVPAETSAAPSEHVMPAGPKSPAPRKEPMIPLSALNVEKEFRRPPPPWKQLLSLLILLGTIMGMVFERQLGLPLHLIGAVGAILLVVTGILTEQQAYSAIDSRTIFIFGGTLSLAAALDQTGAGATIANTIIQMLGTHPSPVLLLVVIFSLACILTNFMSNTATAALLAPIGLSIANTLGADPRAMLMAIVIGCSCAYATPVATPANTMVLVAGRYRFMDYVRAGVPLIVVMALICIPALLYFFPFYP